MQLVGEEIQQLNDILVRRNREYDLVCAENRELVGEINKMIEESNLMNIRLGMWMREVENIVHDNKGYMVERGIINKHTDKISSDNSVSNTNRILATPRSSRYPN